MKNYYVNINGMNCMNCAESVRKALISIDGVEKVQVDLKKGTAKFSAEEPISASEVIDVIEEIGFEFVSMEEKS